MTEYSTIFYVIINHEYIYYYAHIQVEGKDEEESDDDDSETDVSWPAWMMESVEDETGLGGKMLDDIDDPTDDGEDADDVFEEFDTKPLADVADPSFALRSKTEVGFGGGYVLRAYAAARLRGARVRPFCVCCCSLFFLVFVWSLDKPHSKLSLSRSLDKSTSLCIYMCIELLLTSTFDCFLQVRQASSG